MRFYFIGIKGTGMAALACMLHDLGHEVSGSDLEKHFFTQTVLEERHIPIYRFDEKTIEDNTTVIIGNAFLEDFSEVQQARSNPTCKCYRYHEYVGELTKQYHTIAISGSHGKTTTTGLVTSMMQEKEDTGFLIGDGSGHLTPNTHYFCLEADEFRRHFLAYYPKYAIVTNVEIDHVDYFKDDADYRSSFEAFSYQVEKAMLLWSNDPQARLLKLNPKIDVLWFGENETDDICAKNYIQYSDHMTFDVYYKQSYFGSFDLKFVGHHYLLDTLAAIGVGILEGLDAKTIQTGLSKFKGVKRRFVIEQDGENVYVDDYAHHPTEVKVTLETARLRFPNHKIVAIFKPHRASRVKYFVKEFADALSLADEVYLCDFTSIDDKQDGTDIDISYLQSFIPYACILQENKEGAKILAQQKPACFLFMSSKDIYWLADLLKGFQNS